MTPSQRHKTLSQFLTFAIIAVMLLSATAFIVGNASATTGKTVGTTTSGSGGFAMPDRAKGPFYVSGTGLYWLFWNDGTGMVFSSCSSISDTWAAKQTALANVYANWCSICSDGSNFHIAYYGSSTMYYIRGVPASNGNIAWGAAQTAVSSAIFNTPSICVSSDGHVCIGYDTSSNVPHVTRNSNPTSSDTWATASGFPVSVSASAYWIPLVTAGPSGSIYVLYGPNSGKQYFNIISSTGSLGTEEQASLSNCGTGGADQRSIVVDGSTTYILYLDSSSNIKSRVRSSSGTWDASELTLATVTQAYYPVLELDASSHSVYALWEDATNHIISDKYSGGSWGGATTWLDESSDGGMYQTEFSSPLATQNNQLVCAYETVAASPHNIKAASLTMYVPTWAPTFTSTPATTGVIGSSYTYTPTLNESGTIANVQKPAAATFSGGSYSWTPSAAGVYQFEVSGTSTAGKLTKYQFWNVTVPGQWKPTITASPSTSGVIGTAYTTTITANESATFASVIKPTGATFASPTYSWTPSVAGTYEFEVSATSTAGTLTAYKFWNVTVPTQWAPTFTNSPQLFIVSGGSYSYTPTINETGTISAPTIPAWCSFSSGHLTGTPSAAGSYSVHISATSTAGKLTAWENYTITVTAWASHFITTPNASVTVQQPYSYVAATNDTAPITSVTLPAWATLNNSIITGTPTTSGSATFSIKAVGSGTLPIWQNWTVTIANVYPVIESTPIDNGMTLTWYDYQPIASISCTWSMVSNIGDLSVNQYTGEVSGVPGSSGIFLIELTATSTQYNTSATQSFNVTVTLGSLPSGGGVPGGSGSGTTTTTDGLTFFGIALTSEGLLVIMALVLFVIAIVAIASRGRRR